MRNGDEVRLGNLAVEWKLLQIHGAIYHGIVIDDALKAALFLATKNKLLVLRRTANIVHEKDLGAPQRARQQEVLPAGDPLVRPITDNAYFRHKLGDDHAPNVRERMNTGAWVAA